MTDPIMLDLGAGKVSPPGFIPMGREFHGTEIYPLEFADNSVDVIRASHVLEHFGHREVDDVLANWVRVLKPGGKLQIAVPDFEKLAKDYLAGHAMNVPHEWCFMGGQTDENDFHKSLFDREHLRARMSKANLVLLRTWKSELEADCAAYNFSLNIEGTKPAVGELKVCACMSVPRLGFMDNFGSAIDSFLPLNIKLRRHGGAFWGQSLTRCYETAIREDSPDALLTVDYDSVFTKVDVSRLIQLLMVHAEADAICALQSSRHLPTALFTKKGPDGKAMSRISTEEFSGDLYQVDTAHFGLTIFRTSSLEKVKKPWFHSVADSEGRWEDDSDKIDEDINFWVKWAEAGNTLFMSPRIVVGHCELMIRWPGKDFQAIFQPMGEWHRDGQPEDSWK